MKLTLVILAAGCAERPAAPAVRPIMLDASPMLDVYVSATEAWSPLGFDVSLNSTLSECGHSWYVFGEVDCEITIGIKRDPLLRERRGTDALTNRSMHIITIDADLVEPNALAIAMAHEAGHVLLDTAEHTQGGIMGGASSTMTAVDRELACRAISICI